MLMESADRIAIGKEFQSLGPIIEKTLSPKRTLCARGTTALYPSQERRLAEGWSRLILSARKFRDEWINMEGSMRGKYKHREISTNRGQALESPLLEPRKNYDP